MAVDAATALALAEARAPETRSLLERLVARPSPYGSAGTEAQDVLADFLRSCGFEPERHVVDPDEWTEHREYMPPLPAAGPGALPAVNLAAVPAGREGDVRVTLFAHVDTEPPFDGVSAPEAVLEGGRIRGLGAADDKGGLAAAAVAAGTAWQAWGLPVRVLSVHGKGGGARGTLALFSQLGFGADETALYVHPAETGHGLEELKHRSRGVVDLTVCVDGWRREPREIGTPESVPFAGSGNAVVGAVELFEHLCRRLSPDCELNLGRLAGGDAAGTVPLRAEMQLRGLLDRGDARELASRVAALARQWAGEDGDGSGFEVTVRADGLLANPAAVDWDSRPCRILRAAVQEVTGREPAPYRGHLASDIRFPIRVAEIPAVGLGPRAGAFYSSEEWIDLEDVVCCVAVLLLAIHRLSFASPPEGRRETGERREQESPGKP